MAHEQHTPGSGWMRSRTAVTLLVFLGVAAFFLATEHTAHFFGALPFALLLLCPLMHIFMHGGHGGGHAGRGESQDGRKDGGQP